MSHPADTAPWWRGAVIYQVYTRSFQDTNGDGIGDLDGVARRLPYLRWLGVDALWLNPITASADDDLGYDVTDFRAVHPLLGDLAAVDRLIAAAAREGIRVVLDIVPNHTSDRHPWFVDARSSRTAAHRDWYVWADPKPDGSPPNNWISVFGGSAWEPEPATGQSYLHQFLPSQPDLNWWNAGVRREFESILDFWFDRGVAGFRIDTANRVVKDALLRDNPPLGPDAHWMDRAVGQLPVWTASRPEVHGVWRAWRALCRRRSPEPLLVGETWLHDLDDLARYFGHDDELHLNFNFAFLFSGFDPAALREVVERTEAALGALSPPAWPVWTAGNHDVSRFPTRWCGGDPDRARMALLMLLTLRGTPFLYYGDELGMGDVEVPPERAVDPLFHRSHGELHSRDPARTPMRWHDGPGAGFTRAGVEPWLPIGGAMPDVLGQRADPGSTLRLCRDVLHLRRGCADLREGAYRTVEAPDGVWAFRRGEGTLVALNFGTAPAALPGVCGHVTLSTVRAGDGAEVTGELRLAPGEGAVVALGETLSSGRSRLARRRR